ncbi:MAG: Hpt domain-containing protein [Clostridia bacterium]|nr:Hpt domain-containing protein [Clostridia bacterium]
MLTVETLKEYGADVAKGLARCANNEGLYIRLVKICLQELTSDALGEALASGDLAKAFDVAHKLKGGVSNLALDPIAAPISELTEKLRNKTPGDFSKLYDEIKLQTEKLSKLAD